MPEDEKVEAEDVLVDEEVLEEADLVESDEIVQDADLSDAEVEEARQAIVASRDSADRLMAASRELETLVYGVVSEDANSLASTELEMAEARNYLSLHKLYKAKRSVKKAERNLANLEEDVLYLRRSIALLHRLLNEKAVTEGEVENILLRLRSATGAAELGDVSNAAAEVEYLVDDLIGGNSSTLNPFLFRHFWLGVDTRWPAGGDAGVLLVRIINDGPVPIPTMRLAPPVPEGWVCEPAFVDLPSINPGGNVPLRFDIKSEGRYGADEIPLSRKLAISTAYEVRSGEVTCTIRAQNRSLEPLADVLLCPWLPPGYTTDNVPFVERLAPDEVAVIRMVLPPESIAV